MLLGYFYVVHQTLFFFVTVNQIVQQHAVFSEHNPTTKGPPPKSNVKCLIEPRKSLLFRWLAEVHFKLFSGPRERSTKDKVLIDEINHYIKEEN